MADLKVGDKAPSFKIQNEKSELVKLSDFKGKWLVLYFYPKDMTSGCTQEANDFTAQLKKFSKYDATILGVSKDSVTRHQKFIEKEGIGFSLLADEDIDISKVYGVYKRKSLYGREYMGIERSTFIINPQGKIAKIFPKVKVPGHVDAVLEFLSQQ